jgi:hypothetical protein
VALAGSTRATRGSRERLARLSRLTGGADGITVRDRSSAIL